MIYRHSWILCQIIAFLSTGFLKVRQVSPVHPTTEGSVVIIEDETNGAVYRLHLDLIHSTKEVREITPDKIISEGGF